MLKLAFSDRLEYVRKQGFRTGILTFPFRGLGGIRDSNYAMASLDEESSNQIFETLSDWNKILEHSYPEIRGPAP